MVITEISQKWYKLVSESGEGEPTLVWFGYSRAELVGRFHLYIRRQLWLRGRLWDGSPIR